MSASIVLSEEASLQVRPTQKVSASPSRFAKAARLLDADSHALPLSLLLHLAPGAAATVAYVMLGPWLVSLGYPGTLALLVCAALVILPLELAVLMMRGKGRSWRSALSQSVRYRTALPKWQYAAFPLAMVVWGFLASGLTPWLDAVVAQRWFAWLPHWFSILEPTEFQHFARPALLLTFWVGLAVNGLMLPIVEELYFRGFLLPRLQRFGRWAPLINTSLFSVYHLWTPWQVFSRIIWLFPWVCLTWRKQNIYLMMISHCLANTLGWLLLWAMILG